MLNGLELWYSNKAFVNMLSKSHINNANSLMCEMALGLKLDSSTEVYPESATVNSFPHSTLS